MNKKYMLLLLDFLFILIAYFLAFCIRYKFIDIDINYIVAIYIDKIYRIIAASIVYIISFYIFKQYENIWSLASIDEFISGVGSILTSSLVIFFISIADKERIPLLVSIIASFLIIFLSIGMRISYRIKKRIMCNAALNKKEDIKKILVIGAGSAGAIVINECKRKPEYNQKVVAVIDDDISKVGTYISGVKVYGTRNDICNICRKKDIDEVVIAIANLDSKILKEFLDICKKVKVKVKRVPSVSEIINGTFLLSKIRNVEIEDLLDREQVKLNNEEIVDYIKGKVIMVTGGGGSIGSEILRQVSRFNPKQIIIFDIYENNAYDIQNELLSEYGDMMITTLIGSVRDRKRLEEVFSIYEPDVVFHAAAHKHVPLMEDSPMEAIKNNVFGTLNTAELASIYKVKKFVLISTDKAVNPTSIMGATKRICEMIIQGIDKISKTEFVAVRFGNVLGSNGSVIPLFKKQIAKGGPVTVTHKEITRYFMTIPEAAQLVIQAGAYAKGGEIFVLDMGKPVKIYDLAENLIKLSGFEPGKDIEIKVTGLRQGEKLCEELLMNEEGLKKTRHEKIFIGKPSDIDYNALRKEITQFKEVIKLGNVEGIKRKIKIMVPSYLGANKSFLKGQEDEKGF